MLAYPDEGQQARLDTAEQLLASLDGAGGPAAEKLTRALAALRDADPLRAAVSYVDTFDMRRRSTMFLTFWTGGDTRNRGMQMLAFATAYREAGAEPPAGEAPDHLPVVLEFAATVDPEAGRKLLVGHRVSIDVLHQGLTDAESVYADVIAAICHTLPEASDQEVQEMRTLLQSGPPAEAVGLQPYSTVTDLGMPKVPTR